MFTCHFPVIFQYNKTIIFLNFNVIFIFIYLFLREREREIFKVYLFILILMSLLEHHDGREYQRLSNSRVTERSGEIKAWPCRLSASSGCLGALTCSAAIRVEAVKQCWKELGWERASNSHLESEMALYIHVNGMRHTSDLFTEQIQTFICFFGECLPHWSVLELNQGFRE